MVQPVVLVQRDEKGELYVTDLEGGPTEKPTLHEPWYDEEGYAYWELWELLAVKGDEEPEWFVDEYLFLLDRDLAAEAEERLLAFDGTC